MANLPGEEGYFSSGIPCVTKIIKTPDGDVVIETWEVDSNEFPLRLMYVKLVSFEQAVAWGHLDQNGDIIVWRYDFSDDESSGASDV